MLRSRAQSRMAVQMAPDWLKRAIRPGLAIDEAKLAFRPVGGLMIPRQFGPTMRILPRAMSRIRFSSARPSAPSSEKPAEMMIAARMSLSTHCSIIPGTVDAGVAMTARSTFSGVSFNDG